MTPEQKAEELFKNCIGGDANECAIIAVDEIITQWEFMSKKFENINNGSLGHQDFEKVLNDNLEYWKQVKEHLEK